MVVLEDASLLLFQLVLFFFKFNVCLNYTQEVERFLVIEEIQQVVLE